MFFCTRFSRWSALCLLFICGNSFAVAISHTEISANVYEFLLESDKELELAHAQTAIGEVAQAVCKGKTPSYGKYTFEHRKPVAVPTEGSVDTYFIFRQQVECTNSVASVHQRKALPLTREQEKAIKDSVNTLTEKYLAAKDKADFKLAYGYLSEGMKAMRSYETWSAEEAEYLNHSGKLLEREIWRTTIYNNPADSPEPGIYIAADYESSYENYSIHCGFVIWFLPGHDSVDYSVMREEFGNINKDILSIIPTNDLPSVRKQIGCR